MKKIENKILIGFLFAFVVILIITGFTYININRTALYSEKIQKTRQYANLVNKIHIAALDMQASVRGFFISGDSSFLSSYRSNLKTVELNCALLVQYSSGDHELHHSSTEIERLISTEIEILKQQINHYENDGFNSLVQEVRKKQLKKTVDKVKCFATIADDISIKMLQQANEVRVFSGSQSKFLFMFLIIAVLLVLGVLYYLLRRELLTKKGLTDQLTIQNHQLEDFAYIISHNLRGPVGNLKALLDFYKREKSETGKDSLAKKFELAVYRIHNTLDDLTEVLKTSKEIHTQTEILNFESFLQKTMVSYEFQILEFKARITMDFSKVPTVKYPTLYLESIFSNLLSNALKYRSPDRHPEIHFESGLENGMIYLRVSDNGRGLDMKIYGKKLFSFSKTFHQHPDAKGLGLFMTKTQVEYFGGQITADGKENEGMIFQVNFNQPTAA